MSNTIKQTLVAWETPYGSIQFLNHENDMSDNAWVRLSKPFDVEVPRLPNEDIVNAQLHVLAAERAATIEKFTDALSRIDGRIASLRAITSEVSA